MRWVALIVALVAAGCAKSVPGKGCSNFAAVEMESPRPGDGCSVVVMAYTDLEYECELGADGVARVRVCNPEAAARRMPNVPYEVSLERVGR